MRRDESSARRGGFCVLDIINALEGIFLWLTYQGSVVVCKLSQFGVTEKYVLQQYVGWCAEGVYHPHHGHLTLDQSRGAQGDDFLANSTNAPPQPLSVQ